MARGKKSYAYTIFNEIIGKRFADTEEIEEWIRKRTELELPGLSVPGLSELHSKDSGLDFFMDCTFGRNECGRDYADFTLYFLYDNDDNYYITEAEWSY